MSIAYMALAIAATVGSIVLNKRGFVAEGGYMFSLAVWAWGKSDYHDLKDNMRGQ